MTPEQKLLVSESWKHVVPIADAAAEMFYERLFEIDPSIRTLFEKVDLESQRKKLVQALAAVVGALDDIDEIVPEIEALGRRHATYGVMDAHYETVGAALLWTLENGLGAAWTADVESAWTVAYTLVADTMRNAAADNSDFRTAGPIVAKVA